MVNYKLLGFENEDEYYNEFFYTLLPTNHTYDYFVNWEKVYRSLHDKIIEINILNTLTKVPKDEMGQYLSELISKYPEIIPVIPDILAIRLEKEKKIEIIDKSYIEYSFETDPFDIGAIVTFCEKTGLFDLFDNIGDLYTYLIGTEVGLDSNARKNRSGTVFENLIDDFLNEKFENKSEYTFTNQDDVIGIKRTKRADFIISKNGKQKIFIECNFYNSTGSKPIEVGNSYIKLDSEAKNDNLTFIWITDGKGWLKMEKNFREVSSRIDYVLNYNMFRKYLDKFLD